MRFVVENFVHKLDLRLILLITNVSVMNRNSTKTFVEFLTCFESTKTANPCLKRAKTSTGSTNTANPCLNRAKSRTKSTITASLC